jgi:hypothetical protein
MLIQPNAASTERITVNEDFGIIWKEAIVTYFNVIPALKFLIVLRGLVPTKTSGNENHAHWRCNINVYPFLSNNKFLACYCKPASFMQRPILKNNIVPPGQQGAVARTVLALLRGVTDWEISVHAAQHSCVSTCSMCMCCTFTLRTC